ncbi:hypothetical protein Csa_011504 [Cucumis sativus]|nr:hypothetical protein Csa_011504 [Cucumis sativus]
MEMEFVSRFIRKISEASNSKLSREEELEIEEHLKLLNKPSIKTYKSTSRYTRACSYQTKEGDIIDCVDINKQPALDHPLLKNHKVQTLPSGYVSKLFKKDSSQANNGISTLPSNNNNGEEGCPNGFVPIRRTLKKDLIRLKSLSSNNKNQQSSMNPQDDQSDDFFDDSVKFPYYQNVVSHSLEKGTEKYYGTKSYMSVYNVSLSFDQSSSTNIWIVGGPVDSLGVLMTGWLVNPEVNGDFVTRSFVYWTADGGTTTGCYNMYCQGFVQVNPSHHVGAPLLPTSTYEGQQYDYQFTIIQIEGNWWVLVGENLGLGYWPKELIQNLVDGADQIAWGGIAQPSIDGVSPMLGSGHKPNENGDYNEGCYIRNIQIISGAATNTYVLPTWDNTLSYSSNTSCYDLNPNVNCGYDMMEYCFTFGGPGGPNCEATIF